MLPIENNKLSLVDVCDLVADELAAVQRVFDTELTSASGVISEMINQVAHFRGKMLRPMLVILAGKATGELNDDHFTLGAVMEMVHMATLVHDDVLDEADSRRKGKTINALHGNEAAVILGDLLISHSFHLCSSINQQQASRIVANTATTVCEGELLQLHHRGNLHLTEEEYFQIIGGKTASLIAASCYLGCWASKQEVAICEAMQQFGWKLGEAFQINDDLLDLMGTEAIAGKTLGIDLLKEKLTLPMIHYLKHATLEESDTARSILASHEVGRFEDLIQKMTDAGSFDYARARAKEIIEEAILLLPDTLKTASREILCQLASLVVTY